MECHAASGKHSGKRGTIIILVGKQLIFYHRYKEDIRLLAESGIKALRLSISWTRIYPTGEENAPNEDGLRFYEELFTECCRYGIEPVVTLCHFDVPEA